MSSSAPIPTNSHGVDEVQTSDKRSFQKVHTTSTFLRRVSRANLATLVVIYISLVHFVGLYVFTRGFLLTRLSIPLTSPTYTADNPRLIPPTHSKAVVLIIDALRTDFISNHHPIPRSPHHHGILTLPAELTQMYPTQSLIFNAFSDPPTTTMQRIKGIMTGSLPTFVDAGSNFASTAVEEDSLISQLVAANKTLAFMGDDTWANLFPTSFDLSHPYDSFNVEDLHSVDEGVIEHLLPYLQPANSSKWDFLIGHFLGVDHVGHRVGPERDTMRIKLQQMDRVLRDVVDLLDENTLLVVMGDHGMDSKGNHGGDSNMETAAAMWLYSKGAPLSTDHARDLQRLQSWPMYTFPGSRESIRHVNQIDLVPTLALLLGIPIPFNNLGAVIPECFASDLHRLEAATRINAQQIMRYVSEYGDSSVENRLRPLLPMAQSAAGPADDIPPDEHNIQDHGTMRQVKEYHQSIQAHRKFAMSALEHLRALWAQFSVPMIALGLVILILNIPALIALYIGVRNNGTDWDVFVRLALETAAIGGAGVGGGLGMLIGLYKRDLLASLHAAIIFTVIVSEVILVLPLFVKTSLPDFRSWRIQRSLGPLLLGIHAISFASNSFIMWEDRVVLFLLATFPVIHLLKALTAPTAEMRLRIIGLSFAFLAIIRLVGTVTICREEQQPYCRVTFFEGSTPAAPRWALISVVLLAFQLPRLIGYTLDTSRSLAGPAPFFLGTALRAVLTINALYWILEWTESWDGLQPARIPLVKMVKLWLARTSIGAMIGALPYIWFTGSLCIEVKRETEQTGEAKAVQVYGFANAFGSTYLLFLLVPFALIHLVNQPMGQLTLSALLVALLVHLESTDTRRDAILMAQSFATSSSPGTFEASSSTAIVRPTFTDAVPLALMGFLGFFATGHQAVLTSIQWKAAFVGFETVTYPFSPLLVVINTWGPFAFSALALPLVAIWKVSPRPQATTPILGHTLQLALAFIIYHSSIMLASALFAAWLRRHLMVWKVFAPRFMLAGCTLLVIDLSILVSIAVGLRVTSWKVWRTFKSASV
ncbi:MAG: mannose-ethanolamine phosphotransferase gpi13 [Tremellales sp. Tagirdzhanova-0007]|nr:MAG: mannose-ethanolamine phosphotransferase gpi13 [Tremellales sp. Tagirdzhanova-0007]